MGREGEDWVFPRKIQRRIDNTKKETKREKEKERERERGENKKRIVGNSLRPLNVCSISMKLLRKPICLLDRINAIGFEYRNGGFN